MVYFARVTIHSELNCFSVEDLFEFRETTEPIDNQNHKFLFVGKKINEKTLTDEIKSTIVI